MLTSYHIRISWGICLSQLHTVCLSVLSSVHTHFLPEHPCLFSPSLPVSPKEPSLPPPAVPRLIRIGRDFQLAFGHPPLAAYGSVTASPVQRPPPSVHSPPECPAILYLTFQSFLSFIFGFVMAFHWCLPF